MTGFSFLMIGLVAGSLATMKVCALITGDLKLPKRRPRTKGHPKECSFAEPLQQGCEV